MKPCTVIICMELSKLQCSNDDKISLKSNSLIVYSVFVYYYVLLILHLPLLIKNMKIDSMMNFFVDGVLSPGKEKLK